MKKLVVSVFMVAFGLGQAQTIGNSPYASYDIGDIKYNNSVESRSMGGISTAYVWDFNNHFNFQNPAANQNLELASIKIQGTNENSISKSYFNSIEYNKHSTYVSGVSIAFPFSQKVKFGLGFQPYSSKDYSVKKEITLTDGTKGMKKFTGEGSINILQAGLGYSITPAFSLGITSNLYFGKLHDTEESVYENTTLIGGYEKVLNINNFNFTVGSVYHPKLKNNKKFTLGATYTFGNTSDIKATYNKSTYFLANNNKKIQSNLESNETLKNAITQEFSVGLGYGHDAKWFISSQFDFKTANKSKSTIPDLEYQNAYKVALGGWFIPNFNNFRNYFSRVTYRYGAFYEKSNLKIKNTDINRYGIALGASFPFQRTSINRMSSLDLGIELGQRETLVNNLIRDNFINITIGINFANKWFEKQYFD